MKPNQIVDEINLLIYPPKDAILPQLATIRALATSTMKLYESTEEIRTIQTNLKMMQDGIDYLRGAPMMDAMKPTPEDTLKPIYIPATSGCTVISTLDQDGEYYVSIVGMDIEPKIRHPELFGELDVPAFEFGIDIPVVCGKTYLVSQENPFLVNYLEDEYVIEAEEGVYVKEKQYYMEEDNFEYCFLIPKGRTKIKISIFADYEEPIIFNITSHIHFKAEEPKGDEVEPPVEEVESPEEGEENPNEEV